MILKYVDSAIGVSCAIISRAKLSRMQRGADIDNSTVLPNQTRKAPQTSTTELRRNGKTILYDSIHKIKR